MDLVLVGTVLILQILIGAYLLRSSRILGSKITRLTVDQRKTLDQLNAASKRIERVQNQIAADQPLLQLLSPASPRAREENWDYVLSLTSYPARFNSLEESLRGLLEQRLQPKSIYLNIAHDDLAQLPEGVKKVAQENGIQINACPDLGPAKKLIPTLGLEPSMPIIVVDDDLDLDRDLALKLMIVHHMHPASIIASRVHRMKFSKEGTLALYSEWDRDWQGDAASHPDYFVTSGAGTLYKKEFFHQDVLDESAYSKLCFHTDDIWWHFQAVRANTETRKLPGKRELRFIASSQEIGLWQTGNQERNDENLARMMEKYPEVMRRDAKGSK